MQQSPGIEQKIAMLQQVRRVKYCLVKVLFTYLEVKVWTWSREWWGDGKFVPGGAGGKMELEMCCLRSTQVGYKGGGSPHFRTSTSPAAVSSLPLPSLLPALWSALLSRTGATPF